MSVLLDTNTCIAIMRGNPKAVARLATHVPADCVISTVVIYELFVGIGKCCEPDKERIKVAKFLAPLCIISFDESAAKRAGQLRAVMERAGNACGPYDILIAAHALVLGFPIATNNADEFSRVNGLTVEDWLA